MAGQCGYLALFVYVAASGWCLGPVSGAWLVPGGAWVLALRLLFGVVWIDLPLFARMQKSCFTAAQIWNNNFALTLSLEFETI